MNIKKHISVPGTKGTNDVRFRGTTLVAAKAASCLRNVENTKAATCFAALARKSIQCSLLLVHTSHKLSYIEETASTTLCQRSFCIGFIIIQKGLALQYAILRLVERQGNSHGY